MNIITHNIAISLYPKATFNLEVNFAKCDDRAPAVIGRHKYTTRGWELIEGSTGRPDADHRNVERYIGDRHCWMIHLPALSPIGPSYSSILGHSWMLTYPKPNAGYVIQYGLLSLPKMSEVVCTSKTVVGNWNDSMTDWFVLLIPSLVHLTAFISQG